MINDDVNQINDDVDQIMAALWIWRWYCQTVNITATKYRQRQDSRHCGVCARELVDLTSIGCPCLPGEVLDAHVFLPSLGNRLPVWWVYHCLVAVGASPLLSYAIEMALANGSWAASWGGSTRNTTGGFLLNGDKQMHIRHRCIVRQTCLIATIFHEVDIRSMS